MESMENILPYLSCDHKFHLWICRDECQDLNLKYSAANTINNSKQILQVQTLQQIQL